MIRFEESSHTYYNEEGRRIPGISDLLTLGDLVDDQWYTEEASSRGSIVHDLTADFDMDALDLVTLDSPHKGYVLAWVELMSLVDHEWQYIEVMRGRADLGFAGRCDRIGHVFGLKGPTEIKTGEPTKAHPVQTALQAILAEELLGIPAELQRRHCAYLKPNGRGRLVEFTDPADIKKAHELIRKYGGVK